MKYLSRFSWIRVGNKTYRSYDGRLKIYADKKISDPCRPVWILYDVIFDISYALFTYTESRKAAQDIYDLDVKNGLISERFP